MDFAALKAALVGLPDDPAEACAALLAQTTTVTRDIPTADARAVVLVTGEWYAIKQLAKATPTDKVPQAVIAAADIAVDTFTLTDTLHATLDAEWAAMQRLMGALLAAGVVSQGTVDTWTAMRTAAVPVWPGLTPGDVQTARNQP